MFRRRSNSQGVKITPLVGLILTPYSGVQFFGELFELQKGSLKNSFSGVKMTPDMEELPKRSYPVPKILSPLSESK